MERVHTLRRLALSLIGVGLVALLASACGSKTAAGTGPSSPPPTSASPTGSGGQSPIPPEKNPPGDIPDNTVFVAYTSTGGGFTIKVPEGWARATTSTSVSFSGALNGISVGWKPSASAPTVASANSVDVPALRASELAFTLESVKSVSLPGGSAVLITFTENSAPNPVTLKQYRLVVERFEFFQGGAEADLSLSSPVGADNVDPWRTVSESFRWS